MLACKFKKYSLLKPPFTGGFGQQTMRWGGGSSYSKQEAIWQIHSTMGGKNYGGRKQDGQKVGIERQLVGMSAVPCGLAVGPSLTATPPVPPLMAGVPWTDLLRWPSQCGHDAWQHSNH